MARFPDPPTNAAKDSTGTPVTPSQYTLINPATPLSLSNGKGLTVQAATDSPRIISYNLNGKSLSGQADASSYTSTFADVPNVTISSAITVTTKNTVEVAVTRIDGSAAATIDQLSIPNQALVSVDSSDSRSALARTKISTDSTTTADQFVSIAGSSKIEASPVGTPYGFVSNSQLSAGIITW
ncbi:hypothetical protein V3C33_04675 [Micrococcaceae bacterium Sec5.7]